MGHRAEVLRSQIGLVSNRIEKDILG